jgi:hypothetical protein
MDKAHTEHDDIFIHFYFSHPKGESLPEHKQGILGISISAICQVPLEIARNQVEGTDKKNTNDESVINSLWRIIWNYDACLHIIILMHNNELIIIAE